MIGSIFCMFFVILGVFVVYGLKSCVLEYVIGIFKIVVEY